MGLTPGGYGAEEETHRGAGFGLKVLAFFHALANHERMRERDT